MLDRIVTDTTVMRRRAPLFWVQEQMQDVLRRWRDANARLRGQRRRKTLQSLARWAAALLLAGGLAWQSLSPALADAPIFEDPDVFLEYPLNGVDVGEDSAPAFVDIDNDNDFDVFIGEYDGVINYYENTGNAAEAVFTPMTGADNPLDGVDVGRKSTPTFVDVDDDGDFDAFIGEYDGVINYYRNDGTAAEPAFIPVTGSANPFAGVDVELGSAIAFVDWDADGDFDALIGNNSVNEACYRNVGTPQAPVFDLDPDHDYLLFPSAPSWDYDLKPTFADMDGDGDFDAFAGLSDTAYYYRNEGKPIDPYFVRRSGASNPLDGVNVKRENAPALVDIDGDGDLDMFMGNELGDILYFRNDGTASDPDFTAVTGSANSLNAVEVRGHSAPAFADIDGDGDPDAYIAQNYRMDGSVLYYRNDGTMNVPDFVLATGSANPFGRSTKPMPAFVDMDGDGDLDAFSGSEAGTIFSYYRNDGTVNSPSFTTLTGDANPLDLVRVSMNSAPAFVDIDDDGDFDVFVGASNGVFYYRNDGTASAPVFVNESGSANPLAVENGESDSAPAFADIDGDGDFDALIGNYDGLLNYYRNDGTASAPLFVVATGVDNPFAGVDLFRYATPNFVDIDADGDSDVFVGELYGDIYFYQNYGIHRETHAVNGSEDVSFGAGANRVILNANGVDLGATEVAIEANAQATAVEGEAVAHRYHITPAVTSGANAEITFFFSAGEIPAGQSCETLNVYHWNGAGWDAGITPDSRQCAAEPYSLTVSGVGNFSPFVLRSGVAAPTSVSALRFAAQLPGALLASAGALLAGVTAWFGARRKR